MKKSRARDGPREPPRSEAPKSRRPGERKAQARGSSTSLAFAIGASVLALGAVGAVVLLKGSTTLVGAPDGSILVADQGDERLATAGSGDVLTGLILGLLASGVPPQRAAAAGAFLHGRAGALAWRRGLVAGDLVGHLPAAFAEVAGGSIATLNPRL